MPRIARKLKANLNKERLPTIHQQIVNQELSAADVVNKAIKGTLEEPKQTHEKAERLKKYFDSRMADKDDEGGNNLIGFCGSMVPKSQLASRD